MNDAMAMHDALVIEGLDVAYRVRGRDRQVLRDLSLRIGRGETYGLVGESGCGKSTAALAVVRYLPRGGRVRAGRITVDGQDLLSLGAGALRQLRARTVAMVYQDPGRAMNPSITAGRQLAEVFTIAGIRRRRRMTGRWTCCGGCRFPTRRGSWTVIRTNCRAACCSGSSSPWRWRWIAAC